MDYSRLKRKRECVDGSFKGHSVEPGLPKTAEIFTINYN
jgi:hypothetical protein